MLITLDNKCVDTETGEMLFQETASLYDTSVSGSYAQMSYEPPLVWRNIGTRRELEDFFQEDINNHTSKVRWTNVALETLLSMGTDIAEKYTRLARMIVARNIVFDTNDNIARELGIDKSNLPRLWQTLKEAGLIRVCEQHNGGRTYKKIILNPTLVFKTYNQQGKDFSSSLTFSQVHQHYVDQWITLSIESQKSL